jgi:hypothetical protein
LGKAIKTRQIGEARYGVEEAPGKSYRDDPTILEDGA